MKPTEPQKLHMTESEICSAYRQAKDKNQQVQILAECNLTDPEVIVRILSANGYITGLAGNKTAQKELAKQEKPLAAPVPQEAEPSRKELLIGLADKGFTISEAAEALGLHYKTVYNAATRYGIRFVGQRKTASSTGIEKAEKVARKTTYKNNSIPSAKTQEPKAAIVPETVGACADPSGLPPVNWVVTLQLMLTSILQQLLGIDAEPTDCGAMNGMAVVISEYGGRQYRLELSEVNK